MTSTEQDLGALAISLALIAIAALAVRQDLFEHKISNVLTFAALAAGLLIHSAASGLDGFLHALAGAAVGLACLLPMYLGKGMGAGDVKLLGGFGALLGPSNALLAAVFTLVFGAVLAVFVVAWRAVEARAANVRALESTAIANATSSGASQIRNQPFPYAVAIGLGSIATLWERGLLESAYRGIIATGTP